MDILREGHLVLKAEAEAILSASKSLGQAFIKAVRILSQAKGKVIVSGIGKSGITGRRIASVFSSTGTPGIFIHPTEGVHGDIGLISENDVVVLISHSGTSDELLALIPHIKRQGAKIITITKGRNSPISKFSDIVLATKVNREACPFNLVPSTSSAVTAAIGDSLAIALLKIKGFKKSDYKNVHPGGEIGKRLLFRVEDLMLSGNRVPVINENRTLKDAILIMSKKKLGMTCVLNKDRKLRGIVTDGDLRRLLEKRRANLNARIATVMKANPKTVLKTMLVVEALSVMEKYSITSLIVVNNRKQKRIIGVIHLHSILKAGVV
jgi:arabinose-5-phosphate isomerase